MLKPIRIASVLLTLAFFSGPGLAQTASDGPEVSVRAVQEHLKDLGFAAGPSDGILGPQTRGAIRAFERAIDRPVTGEPDGALLRALRARQADAADSQPERDAADGSPDEADTSSGPTSQADSPASPQSDEPPAAGPDTSPARTSQDGDQKSDADLRGSQGTNGDPTATRAARAAGKPSEPAPEPIDLPGTSWRFVDANGARFTLHFAPDGRLDGPTEAGTWTWREASGSLVITFDAGGNLRTRRVAPWPTGERMSGAAASAAGESWTWEAARLTSR